MNKYTNLIFLFILYSINNHKVILAQCTGCTQGFNPNETESNQINRRAKNTRFANGDSVLGLILDTTLCGLNFVEASVLTETRSQNININTNGTGFPTTDTVSGLPPVANHSCTKIFKAYLYYNVSYTEASPPASVDTITNPSLIKGIFNPVIIGVGGSKCWSETGTAVYRADVSSIISGNGVYKINISGFANASHEIDGVTLFIIYIDGSVSYSGSLVFYDGEITVSSPTAQNFTGFNVCATDSSAEAFSLTSDMQHGANNSQNVENYNGNTETFPNLFYQFNEITTTVTTGQTSSINKVYTNDVGDCYSWFLSGLYWQTTTCRKCLVAIDTNLAVTAHNTNAHCSKSDGTAWALVNDTGKFDYLWSNGETTDTATGLSGGTYTVMVSQGCLSDSAVVKVLSDNPRDSVISVVNVSCYGKSDGRINSIAFGGKPPYMYNWSNGATTASLSGLSAGDYMVTLTDSDGCANIDTINITSPAKIIPAITGKDSICSGAPDTLTANGANSYLWNPGKLIGQTVIVAPASTTIYTVIATVGNCSAVDSFKVSVIPPPNLKITGLDSLCYKGTTTLVASGGSSYIWSNGATTNSITVTLDSTTLFTSILFSLCKIDTIQVLVYVHPAFTTSAVSIPPITCRGDTVHLTASGATTYSWMPAAGLSCTRCADPLALINDTITYTVVGYEDACTDTGKVTVDADSPIKTVVTPKTTKCAGDNGSASIAIDGGTPAYTYSWFPGYATSSEVTGLSAGVYVITVVDSVGCKTTTTTVIPTSTAIRDSIVSYTNEKCYDVNIGTAVIGAIGGGTPYTYFWYPDTLYVPDVTGLSAGYYTVVVTDTNGCIGFAAVTITQPTELLDSVKGVAGTCSGHDAGTAYVNVFGGTSPYTYLWSNGQSGGIITGLTGGIYTITLTDNNGCIRTDTANVIIHPTPTITISPPTLTLCSGDSNVLVATGATTYLWKPASGLSCTSCANPEANPLKSITYTVVGTTDNCMDSASIAVTLNITPAVSVTPLSKKICTGDTVNFTASGAATYLWTPAAGLSCTGCPNPSASPTVTTTYTVSGTTNGCTSTDTVTIFVTSLLNINVTPTSPVICLGKSVSLTATGATNYNWTPINADLSCDTCSKTIASPTVTTTYTVIGSQGLHCGDTVTLTVTVQMPPAVTISGPDSICAGQIATLTAGGASSYIWSNGNSTQSNEYTVTKDTTVWLAGTTGVCTDSINYTIGVYPPLTITSPSYDTICYDASAKLLVAASGGKKPYTYLWNNGIKGDTAGPLTVTPKKNIWYSVLVEDNCGESYVDSFNVVVIPTAGLASFKPVPDTIPGGGMINFINNSTGADSYYWTFGDGSSSNVTDPNHGYDIAGIYKVILYTIDKYGCSDTAWEYVDVIEKILVPNVFTPNGDGINDGFIVIAGSMKEYNLVIYNRWGQLIFKSNSPAINWTGNTLSGARCPDGTYFYILTATDYNDQPHNLAGFVQLIR